jgi:hypothetical protein
MRCNPRGPDRERRPEWAWHRAFAKLGCFHPVSALWYGGVVVVAVDSYRRLFKRR